MLSIHIDVLEILQHDRPIAECRPDLVLARTVRDLRPAKLWPVKQTQRRASAAGRGRGRARGRGARGKGGRGGDSAIPHPPPGKGAIADGLVEPVAYGPAEEIRAPSDVSSGQSEADDEEAAQPVPDPLSSLMDIT